jgi:hypothetical protein
VLAAAAARVRDVLARARAAVRACACLSSACACLAGPRRCARLWAAAALAKKKVDPFAFRNTFRWSGACASGHDEPGSAAVPLQDLCPGLQLQRARFERALNMMAGLRLLALEGTCCL